MWNYNFTVAQAPDFNDEDLSFVTQLGLKYIYTVLPPLKEEHSAAAVKRRVSLAASHGVVISNLNSGLYIKPPDVFLGEDTRDETIKGMIDFFYVLAEAGFTRFTMTWEPDQVWSTHHEALVRGCKTRYVNLDELTRHPFTHGREYELKEIWDAFSYFMDRIMPVCEKTGIKIVLHPNDPPTYLKLGGCPCLIKCLDDYKKAFEIAGSDMLGMEFCCGCWLEGRSEGMGDILGDLDWCLENNKVEVVHFRNIDKPLPEFTEVFPDMGYFDMYKIMRLLCKHDYQGMITLDHTPQMVDGSKKRIPTAYAIAYMRALAERAIAELVTERKL